MTLQDSYAACRAITKERAKNFYYGIRLLPERKRDALCSVYAYFRICDDLSDDEAIGDKQAKLDRWRHLLDEAPGSSAEHEILPAFYNSIKEFAVPKAYFEELLEGTLSDLTVTRYQTFADLYKYCYRVASTVGLVCLHVFGFDGSPEALAEAEARGIAFQLTNILRDVAEDGERGRIYIPLSDLETFGLSEADFFSGEKSQAMEELLSYQIGRAKEYYERSAGLFQRVDLESRSSLEAMTSIYRALLAKVESMGVGVFKERARLSKMEKLKLAGKTMLSLTSS